MILPRSVTKLEISLNYECCHLLRYNRCSPHVNRRFEGIITIFRIENQQSKKSVVRGSETGTSSVYCAQLKRFHLKTKTESSFRNVVLYTKGRAADSLHGCDPLGSCCFCLDFRSRCCGWSRTVSGSLCHSFAACQPPGCP
jgi:hypothetical protein